MTPRSSSGAVPFAERLRHPEDDRDGGAQLVAQPGDQLMAAGGTLQEGLLRHLELPGASSFALQGVGELLDHGGGHLGGDDATTRRGLADGVQDLVAVGVLQDIARSARHEHLADRTLVLRAGEGDDPDVVGAAPSAAGSPRSRRRWASARPSGRRRVRWRGPAPPPGRRRCPGLPTRSSSVSSSITRDSRKPALSSTTSTRTWRSVASKGRASTDMLEVSAPRPTPTMGRRRGSAWGTPGRAEGPDGTSPMQLWATDSRLPHALRTLPVGRRGLLCSPQMCPWGRRCRETPLRQRDLVRVEVARDRSPGAGTVPIEPGRGRGTRAPDKDVTGCANSRAARRAVAVAAAARVR